MAWTEPHEPIVQRAFMALLGFSTDWKADLVPLLRSDEPISPFLRDMIADAIEGRGFTGVTLQLHGQQRLANWMDGVKERRRWMEIGRWVADEIARSGVNRLEAFGRAADIFPESDSNCKRHYYYFGQCTRWMEQARLDGQQYAAMDDEQLASIFHFAKAAKLSPLNGPEYDRTATDTLDWLRERVEPRLGPNAVKVIWSLCHIHPLNT